MAGGEARQLQEREGALASKYAELEKKYSSAACSLVAKDGEAREKEGTLREKARALVVQEEALSRLRLENKAQGRGLEMLGKRWREAACTLKERLVKAKLVSTPTTADAARL